MRDRLKNRPLCTVCLILTLLFCIGAGCGREKVVSDLRPSAAELKLKEGDHITFAGRVYQKSEKQDYQILYLKNNSIKYQQQSLKESKMIVYDEKKKNVDIGDVVSVQGELRFFEDARNPGNFDMRFYYQKQGIHVNVWADSVKKCEGSLSTTYEKIKNRLYELRLIWKRNLCDAVGDKDGNILSAIILGDKTQIDPEVKEMYQINGIGHILAISGLHLSFLGIGIYSIFRRVSGSYLTGGIAGILFLSFYILMVGTTVSSLRALIMFLFRVGADMTGRNYDSITALSFAAAAVLIWRPLSVFDGGFWLSFGAVLAIIVILPAFSELPFQGIWASVSIQLVIFPVLLYCFYEFPLYSILLNLFVIPVMSLLLFFASMGNLLCCVFFPAGRLMLRICTIILRLYELSCHLTMKLPAARVVTGQPKPWQIAVYYICLTTAVIWYIQQGKRRKKALETRKKKRKWPRLRRISLPLILLFAGTAVLMTGFGRHGNVNVTVLDVGQGDGIYIKGPRGGSYFIDGGSSDVKKAGQYRIEPFLLSQGVKRLDYVFLSHGDSDHISGIEEMIEREEVGVEIGKIVFPVHEVWDDKLDHLARKAVKKQIPIAVLEPGKGVKEEEMSLTCLSPGKDFEGEAGNEASMVMKLSYKGFDMLLTGDTEGAGEETLTEELKGTGNIEVLKAAHHGSKNSSGEEFLKETAPIYTIISAGAGNRYGHPHKETLDRLEKTGSKVYVTKDCGAITVAVKDGTFTIKKYATE